MALTPTFRLLAAISVIALGTCAKDFAVFNSRFVERMVGRWTR